MPVSGLVAALLVLTACTSNGHDAAAQPTGSAVVTSSPPGTPDSITPSLSTPVSPQPSRAPSSGSGRCTTSSLSAALRMAGPGAGNRYAFLTLTNRSAAPCRMYGYVGLGLIGADGRPLPTQVARLAPQPPASITLPPGGSAYTRLHWTVVAGVGEPEQGPCRPTPSRLWVTPPDERSHLTIPWSLGEVCGSGKISVIPVTAGSAPR
jgi:hypothetical protein